MKYLIRQWYYRFKVIHYILRHSYKWSSNVFNCQIKYSQWKRSLWIIINSQKNVIEKGILNFFLYVSESYLVLKMLNFAIWHLDSSTNKIFAKLLILLQCIRRLSTCKSLQSMSYFASKMYNLPPLKEEYLKKTCKWSVFSKSNRFEIPIESNYYLIVSRLQPSIKNFIHMFNLN